MIREIHGVWLGKKFSPLANACINDWEKQGYSIKIWTEEDELVREILKENRFVRECLERKLYAFASDYIRLKVLEKHGGLYLDTDVTILKDPFALFENCDFSAGFECFGGVVNAVMYSEKNGIFIRKLTKFYEEEIYSSDLYTGPDILTALLEKEGLDRKSDEFQDLKNGIKIYPTEYFGAYTPGENLYMKDLNENSYLLHWYSNSWGSSRKLNFLRGKNKGILGKIYIWQKYFVKDIVDRMRGKNHG